MKISANSNMYTFNAAAVLQKYGDFVQASSNVALLVFTSTSLSESVKDAIRKTAAALNLGEPGWVKVEPGGGLSDSGIWFLTEGLDPICVVCCDETAGKSFAQAYKTNATHDSVVRIMCRSVCFFDDLELLLSKDKQRAWSVFKCLV